MSNCTIKGCANKAVARGLCAMHYMRQRRRGDPEAPFKPGRQPKPHPKDPGSAALRRENAALREENAELKRRLEEAQAHPAAAPSGGTDWSKEYSKLYGHHARLTKENSALKKQLANARAANPGVGPAEEAAAGRLAREIDRLKGALAKTEAKLAADPGEVGKLERQTKALTTQVQNLKTKMHLLTEHYSAGLATAGGMPFATQSAIAKCLHPDTRNHATEADKDKAFQRFTAWKADKDKAVRKAK